MPSLRQGHQKFWLFALLLASGALASSAPTNSAPLPSAKPDNVMEFSKAVVERKLELFEQHERMTYSGLDDLLRERFDLTGHPERLSDSELKEVYRALYAASYYGPYPKHVLLLEKLSEQLAERKIHFGPNSWLQAEDQLRATRDALLNARMFKEAEDFAESFDLGKAAWRLSSSSLESTNEPTILRVQSFAGQAVLSRQPVDIARGIKVVAHVHPNCGFSRKAMKAFTSNQALKSKLAQRTLWVAGQWATSDLDAIVEWNEKHPATEIEIAYRNDDWPGFVAFVRTPVFYVLRDGKLVDRLVGWTGPEQGKALLGAVASAQQKQTAK